jgi:hypothetical protein
MLHTSPRAQAWPQLPQLVVSVIKETHRPAHAVCPVGQAMPQAPIAQSCPAGQAISQDPQWSRSVCVSTHWLPHAVCPVVQVTSRGPRSAPVSPVLGVLPQATQRRKLPRSHFSDDARIATSLQDG